MKKESFIKLFAKDIEKDIQKLYNDYSLSLENNIIVVTDEFYTPIFWKKIGNKINNISIYHNGLFGDSDRCKIAFVPIDYDGFDVDYGMSLLKIIIKTKFKKYEHKDILGSIMGLNIKRELIGDVILNDNVAYVPVSNKIVNYVLSELNQIGKDNCSLEIIENNEEIPQYKYDDKIITVPSKRLDSIVSAITNVSRTKIIEQIEKGKILVDYIEEKDKSKVIEIGATITIRGFGKYKLFLDKGESKKGKEKIQIKKYI